jgi:hypothetical protein
MLPFGVTILATVPQRSEIRVGLMNYPIFALYRSGIGIRHAFAEKNRADDVTSPSRFYFMEMAEEGKGMIKIISTGPAQLSFDKIKSQNIFITYTCL